MYIGSIIHKSQIQSVPGTVGILGKEASIDSNLVHTRNVVRVEILMSGLF